MLYDLLLKDKVELKFMGQGGGFCYIKTLGNERRYVITQRAWLNTYLKLGGSDGMSSEK